MTVASVRQLLACGHSQHVPAVYAAEVGSTTTCLTCDAEALVVGLVWVDPPRPVPSAAPVGAALDR